MASSNTQFAPMMSSDDEGRLAAAGLIANEHQPSREMMASTTGWTKKRAVLAALMGAMVLVVVVAGAASAWTSQGLQQPTRTEAQPDVVEFLAAPAPAEYPCAQHRDGCFGPEDECPDPQDVRCTAPTYETNEFCNDCRNHCTPDKPQWCMVPGFKGGCVCNFALAPAPPL